MIILSERLRLIETLVPDGAAVCDVGTDHAYLPAALIMGGRVRSVIATDLREKPLLNAKENLSRLGIDGVQLRLCDGLSAVGREEADTVIIAGMGGEVIAGIISRALWLCDKSVTLILQAMTSCEALRDYLAGNGFAIEKEITLTENGKVYSVIVARYDGKMRDISPVYRYIGGIKYESCSDKAYIEKQYKRLNDCAVSLEGVEGQEERCKEYKTAADGILRLMEDADGI